MTEKRVSVGAIIAEFLGGIFMLAVAVAYMAMTGGYIINGIGFFFLLPISFVAYLTVTTLQYSIKFTAKTRWIMYAAKLVFVLALLVLSPALSDFMARVVNG